VQQLLLLLLLLQLPLLLQEEGGRAVPGWGCQGGHTVLRSVGGGREARGGQPPLGRRARRPHVD
jgi:hypothetical protein